MEWLNYHHLLYFWMAAREGSISRASEELRLSQPTLSAQIRTLEEALGEKLFARVGRNLVLTDMGRIVFRYADEIFSLGRELMDTVQGRPTGQPVRFTVGIADVVPKLVAYRLLEPALQLAEPVRLICREDKPDRLLAALALNELDLVLSEAPIDPTIKVQAYSHVLGECGVTFFGTAALTKAYRPKFPQSLTGAPVLLPTDQSVLRRSLERWFAAEEIYPVIVGEFEDSALLKVFGQIALGVFAAPSVIEKEVKRQYGVQVIGRVESVRESFYAISVERRIKHPAVAAIAETAQQKLFS